MPEHKYLIIGGGMTADAAAKGILQTDKSHKIGMISSDKQPPYNSPALSKALWKGEPLDSIWRNTPKEHVDIYLGRLAKSVDVQQEGCSR